ncbi:uncharacterized protein LACBIDRAFT_298581 [Laccaria bicolor S238N-H82]|uniref:Predicted protein n=1 Tax=Laccaria bicolor (strain S238N-H82 / ATCC MYA-4686) TaxID=486041 RepID=B0DD56_LACBS|nr:uncharacterized protein LACBIDRAFT_298581 [Laccaria bicolor S238N-H82]EDR07550.1 predicted protein [Laccaria bicolor S238N-H82]|eukprot:XP_001881942.1 predicted protein [Laccaria bicolor S238N-H82]
MPTCLTGVCSPRAPSTLADDPQGAPSMTVLEDLFNNLGICDRESHVLITSVIRLVTPAHRDSPNNSQATAVEDGFEVLSSPGPHAEVDDGDDNDGDASEMVTPQVTNSPAAAVIPPSAVTASVAVTAPIAAAPNAISPATNAIGLPVLYAPGYALHPSRPDNAILPPGNLITAIYGYHIPPPNAGSPFFCVSRGRDIGIFCGWEVTSPLVIGVSCSSFSRVASVMEGHRRMAAALTTNFALYLT